MLPAKCETRQQRKQVVFRVMYGSYSELTEAEMTEWRGLCAEWINHGGHYPPLTPAAFTAFKLQQETETQS